MIPRRKMNFADELVPQNGIVLIGAGAQNGRFTMSGGLIIHGTLKRWSVYLLTP